MGAPAHLTRRLSASAFLTLGVYQVLLGAYFATFRPALLPEDLRFIGAPLPSGVEAWLELVFRVMGGQMAALGVILILVSAHFWQSQGPSRLEILMLCAAGLASAGVMSVTNFTVGSDFKWALLFPVILWVLAITLMIATPAARPLGSR